MIPERMDQKAEKRVALVLKHLGYEKKSLRIEGKLCKRWVRRT